MIERFRADYDGIGALLNSAGVALEMRQRARRVADAARQLAPVVSGSYRDSIEVQEVRTDRATARVVAGVDHAVAVEFGTRTLGRALDAARD